MRRERLTVRSPDTAVAATLFGMFVAMVAMASRYPHEARLVPLVVGIPAMLLAGWQLWREIAKNRSHTTDSKETDHDPAMSMERGSMIWLVLFSLIVLAGGLVVGGTLAVMACQRLWLNESWRTTAIGGGIAFLVSYVCFERGLGLALFGGWLALAL